MPSPLSHPHIWHGTIHNKRHTPPLAARRPAGDTDTQLSRRAWSSSGTETTESPSVVGGPYAISLFGSATSDCSLLRRRLIHSGSSSSWYLRRQSWCASQVSLKEEMLYCAALTATGPAYTAARSLLKDRATPPHLPHMPGSGRGGCNRAAAHLLLP